MRKFLWIALLLLASGCNLPAAAGTEAAPPPASLTPPLPPPPTSSPTLPPATTTSPPSATASPAPTQTASFTPAPTETASPSLTPTFALPRVTVSVAAAHCRYGPHTAYLHAADLYEGDTGTVWNRWYLNGWLFVQFDKLSYPCWVAPSVVNVDGDISHIIKLTEIDLTRIGSNQYGPPKNVTATRSGNEVTISWSQVEMTEDKDRGYFLELWVCQNGAYLWWPVSFPDQYTTHYTVRDEAGCNAPSQGVIYTVEKHGYSQPKPIVWPAP